MIKINIICVGKLSEDYLKDMQKEYLKRLSKMYKVEITELADEKLPLNMSENDALIIKEKESNKIIDKLSKLPKSYIIVLDEYGKEYTSHELANKIQDITLNTSSEISFIIGGSLGLSDKLKATIGNEVISFSRLTFLHGHIRMFLLEQLFRIYKITNKQKYHH